MGEGRNKGFGLASQSRDAESAAMSAARDGILSSQRKGVGTSEDGAHSLSIV